MGAVSENPVLVTGAVGAEAVATELKARGAEPLVVEDPERLADAVAGKTFQGYVQLPMIIEPGEGSVVRRVEQFLTGGLLNRFRIADTVTPVLADGASVVLVAGNTASDLDAPDDRAARLSLLRVLGHALRADRTPARVRVRIFESGASAELVAAAVLGDASADASAHKPVVSDAETSYADWRVEVIGMVGGIEF